METNGQTDDTDCLIILANSVSSSVAVLPAQSVRTVVHLVQCYRYLPTSAALSEASSCTCVDVGKIIEHQDTISILLTDSISSDRDWPLIQIRRTCYCYFV